MENVSGSAVDVSAMAMVVVRENQQIPAEIRVLVSKALGKIEMVIGLEDL